MRLRWLTALALTALAVALVTVYDRAVLHFLGWDGRHKVGGTSWCTRHHLEARPELSVEELLAQILAELRRPERDAAIIRQVTENRP